MRIGSMAAALLILIAACSNGGALPGQPSGLSTSGLEGTVRRGPIEPVCRQGIPCDAPLQADFTLQQDGRVVARFASDSAGHFSVYVAPGSYVVVPDQPVGIGPQALQVVVNSEGLTHVELTFDTGIR